MKKLILLITFITALAAVLSAQEPDQSGPDEQRPNDARRNVLREIGLTPDQARQIRRLNVQRRPLMEDAQRKLREANRSLDEAIYADVSDEALVLQRLKEAQAAQAELIRLRSMNELGIRRILTPEQLTKFRELRERFEMVRQNVQDHRRMVRSMKRNGEQRPANGFTKRPGKQRTN
jgi:Spy/CpxP family protein refolding chaperone